MLKKKLFLGTAADNENAIDFLSYSFQAVCDWQNPNHHDIETPFAGVPLVILKGQENQKALMVAQAKSLMVVSAK